MISEGPNLIEALSGDLQNALNGELQFGEELQIAVRAGTKEALAATATRLLLLKEPLIPGTGLVEVRSVSLAKASNFRADPRGSGGRLSWSSTESGAPTSIDFPSYDFSKYSLVAQRLQQTVGDTPAAAASNTNAGAASAVSCPKCRTSIPEGGCWCPSCGLQALDPCWSCGKPLAEGANFCAYCGTPNTEPAVATCPSCQTPVARGTAYCTACGSQSRPVCADCDSPMRSEWSNCPSCGGKPEWDRSIGQPSAPVMRARSQPDPGAWLPTTPPAPRASNAEELNAAGIREYEAENFSEAARLFQQAIQADGNNASFHTNLGVAYGELGDDLQAFGAYRRAVELNPRELAAYLNMGYLYNERERQAEAREMWEKVVQLAPDSEEAEEARENLRNVDEV